MSLVYDIELYTGVSLRDRIDSRDLIEARDKAQELLREDDEAVQDETVEDERDLLDADERADLEAIIAAIDELDGCCEDWSYGAALIPEHEWVQYAEEYASDVHGFRDDGSWPFSCIDWEEAAEQLAVDYTTIEFDGESYYVR